MKSDANSQNQTQIMMFWDDGKYFSKSSEFHVHLLNVDLLPWSLGPILYIWLAQKRKTNSTNSHVVDEKSAYL